MPATLLELTEPLFQYICQLNRAGRQTGAATRTGGTGNTAFFARSGSAGASLALDETAVRAELKSILEGLHTKAAGDYRLTSQVEKVELALIFFADSMIAESRLPFAEQWNQNRMAYERNELAGDEKFFDLLDETTKDPSDEATERLAVFYTCIGLGFTGIYFNQPELLRKTMLGISSRIRSLLTGEMKDRLCPDTYSSVDTRNLIPPPSNRLVVVGILFACFTIAVLVAYIWMYRDASSTLNAALDLVLQHDPTKR